MITSKDIFNFDAKHSTYCSGTMKDSVSVTDMYVSIYIFQRKSSSDITTR